MSRRSSRILNRDGKKFDSVMKYLCDELDSFDKYHGPMERSCKIREMFNIIYDARELMHMFLSEDFVVKFMKKYIKQGNGILNSAVAKSHINICRGAIKRTIKYAQKYLQKKDIMAKRALYKISQKTCKDVSKIVVSFL